MSEVSLYQKHAKCRSASEREGNNLNGCKDFRTESGSSQGHNLPLVVPWFDRGADVCGGVAWPRADEPSPSTGMVNPQP